MLDKLLKKQIKAEFTVETVIVFPIVLFAIISIMYLLFYVHDCAVLSACAYNAGIESVFENTDLHAAAKSEKEQLYLLSIRNTGVWTEGTDEKKVKYLGKFTVPFALMQPFIENESVVMENKIVEKMDIEKMYLFKVAADKLLNRK